MLNFLPLFHTSYAGLGGMNLTGFGTPESDSVLHAINEADTPAEKAKPLRRLQEILCDEATFLSLYYLKDRLAVHRRFGNVKVSGHGDQTATVLRIGAPPSACGDGPSRCV